MNIVFNYIKKRKLVSMSNWSWHCFISCKICVNDYAFKYKFEEENGYLVYKNFVSVIKHFNGIEYLNTLNNKIDEYMKSSLKIGNT